MARLRTPFVSGQITDNPLAIGATTINGAGLAGLPAVASPNTMALILDPTGVGGTPEVVYVTAHTAVATSATIQRAREGTVARAHNLNTIFIHAPTVNDFGYTKGADLASAATLTLPDTSSDYFIVTGTTTITAISAREGGRRVVLKFSGACPITNGASLILAGAASITTVANQVLEFISEDSGVWRQVANPPAPALPPAHDNNSNQGGSVSLSTQSAYFDSGSLTIPADGTYLVIAMINIANNIVGVQHSFTAAVRNQANTVLLSKGCAFEGNAAVGANHTLTLTFVQSLSNGNTIKCSGSCSTTGSASLAVQGQILYVRLS
jgi:hypothetical protein